MIDNHNTLRKGTLLYSPEYKYQIVKTLGNGSFGITYMASVNIGEGLQAYVAIKEFFLNNYCYRDGNNVVYSGTDGKFDRYLKKFKKEIDHLTRLDNEGVIKVMDAFEGNGTAYYVMEYVDGGSLEDYLKRNGRFDEQTAIDVTINIGNALSYLHNQGILHLDLKPQNIMLRETKEPVIIDFGLSKLYEEGSGLTSTLTHEATSGYAPVEQYNYSGNGFPVTMDIYALGGTLYKMLCGQVPPHADVVLNTDGIIASNLKNNDISDPVIAIVDKAMQPRVKNRYQTVGEMMGDLMELLTPEKHKTEETEFEPEKKQSYTKKRSTQQSKELKKKRAQEKEEKSSSVEKDKPSKKDDKIENSGCGSYFTYMWIWIIAGLLFGVGPARKLHDLIWPKTEPTPSYKNRLNYNNISSNGTLNIDYTPTPKIGTSGTKKIKYNQLNYSKKERKAHDSSACPWTDTIAF